MENLQQELSEKTIRIDDLKEKLRIERRQKKLYAEELKTLQKECKTLQSDLARTERQVERLQKDFDDCKSSKSYRLGHAIMSIPGKIKWTIKRSSIEKAAEQQRIAEEKAEEAKQKRADLESALELADDAGPKIATKMEQMPLEDAAKIIDEFLQDDTTEILLITNRDSDNVGDQVIEACDISLIKTIMKNLGFDENKFVVVSRAAGMINKKYLRDRKDALLDDPEEAIANADLVLFGGAPLFNWHHQIFYERTAITMELAQKHNKPVVFSAIGVEGFDENNERCARLKKTLNFDSVKQITTRDDFESLEKYVENENILIDKVADPAVFTEAIFNSIITSEPQVEKPKVGIFILRAQGFMDNGVNLTADDAAKLWLDLAKKLEESDLDYEFITSGHFGDEAFLDRLVTEYNAPLEKCVFNMNDPESLVNKIKEFSAVVSTRLHPNIISYSLGVPAVGLVWNDKVSHFYKSIGYEDRIINAQGVTADILYHNIKKIIDEGVTRNPDYMMTVYNTMFNAFQKHLPKANKEAVPYTFQEICENVVPFTGTSFLEKQRKLMRKFRRSYGGYNLTVARKRNLEDELKKLKDGNKE